MLSNREYFEKLILENLCSEYQSIWICNVERQTIDIYVKNDMLSVPDLAQKLEERVLYDAARNWYIDSYVMEDHKERVREETRFEYVLEQMKYSERYVVEFKRVIDDEINYNQLFYSKINPEPDKLTHFIMGFRDYDYKKKAERDELTGIYNRKAFLWHADKMIKSNPEKTYNLILSDFVNFKDYNEKFGQKAGDEVLAAAGKYLNSISSDNTIAGRYGGDQFVVLIEDYKYDEFYNAVYADMEENGNKVIPGVDVKYGICKNIDHNKPVLAYCDYAHIAVNSIKHIYAQKMAEFNDEIKEFIERQRIIENDMKKALDEGQFKVYYQPKHDTYTGKIVGAEALVRWEHPEYGMMSPAEFIPLFEKNGFIENLDLYVFDKTCQNIRKWIDEGHSIVPVSVNASKITVESQAMVYSINKSMRKNNIPGNLIHIEITESLMSENTEMLLKRLEPLKERGVQVELDDFGAGYASINMLSTLPLDVIKLDMSFMRQFGDYKRAKVLEGCVKLAKSLGYKTVSEGVETQEQLEALQKLGVDIIQGYFFSKPISSKDFEVYLDEHS